MTDATAPRQARPRGTARRSALARSRPQRNRSAKGSQRALRYCLGPGLVRAMRGATANVERYVPELNALNVYPVPDGDTGINMIATMRAALAEVEAIPAGSATLSELATAISFGALMGARGNSGVILSQVFRGMADTLSGKRRADGRDLAAALTAGTATAYSAVARPVEGTILTVAREAARAATAAAERGEPLETVLAIATDAARQAVERTPDQLDVLREAGVVDAGGQGLYRALEGALGVLMGDAEPPVVHGDPRSVPRGVVRVGLPAAASEAVETTDAGRPVAAGEPPQAKRAVAAEPGVAGRAGAWSVPEAPDGTWGYETVYLLHGQEPLDAEGIRRQLEEIGESVLVAGDERLVKVHVHNDRPDEVIALGLGLGSLSQVTVQNLDEQTSRHGAVPQDTRSLAVLAVAAGDGLARVFESFGVERIVVAPRAGKSSAGELVQALRSIDAPAVIVLPNDPDVVLAAEQAAREFPDKEIVVVPTRSAPEGFAALLAMDPTVGAGHNLAPMLAAARDVRTLQVAAADRRSRLAGRTIEPGQFIVLGPDDGLLHVADDPVGAISGAVAVLDPGFELLTLYLGEGASAAEADEIVRVIGAERPGTEIEVLPGGQPHYRYLISVE
jgi:DAK2 domain fusion protein YloV